MPQTIILHPGNRTHAARVLDDTPDGWRVAFSEPKRSVEQSDKMWAMLSDFSKQVTHYNLKYSKDDWKEIFYKALKKETRLAPALDGDGLVSLGARTSSMSIKEMSDMIEMIYAEGAQRGVVFKEPDQGRSK